MSRLLRLFRRLLRDEGGAVAIMLTLSLIPLSIAAIGAVDLERGLSARTQLQDALDAAALAALKASANDANLLQSTGAAAFAQNLGPSPDLKVVAGPTFVYGDQGKVLADATASVDTIIASWVIGHPLNVAAHAEIVRSDVKLEIALVLDNSGSMADNNKIGDLKIGATDFLNIMQTASTQRGDPNSVLISLVPFSQTVRVDPSNQGAKWLDTKGQNSINGEIFSDPKTNRFDLFAKLGTTWAGCLESRKPPFDVQDDAAKGKDKLFTPYFWPDEYDGASGIEPNNYLPDGSTAGWQPQERNVAKYVKTTGLSPDRGPNKDCKMLPVRPLSNDFATLRSDVSKMAPVMDTNIAMGLVWGWHTISPNGPFATSGPVPVAPYGDPKHSKIAVVMTDGWNEFVESGDPNNHSLYEGLGYIWQNRISNPDGSVLATTSSNDARTAALDARLAKLCVNMKAKGVEIYAIAVGVDPAHLEPLKSCASGADHYYDVSNGAGMIDAFNSIANQIANLHLSR